MYVQDNKIQFSYGSIGVQFLKEQEVDERRCVCLYVDFKRTFETIDKRMLLMDKCVRYVVKNTAIERLKSYLVKTYQITTVNHVL